MRIFFYILLSLFIFSCNQQTKTSNAVKTNDTASVSKPITDSYPRMKVWTQKEIDSNQRKIEEYEKLDSTRLSRSLLKALSYSNKNKLKASFTYSFKMLSPDSSFESSTDIVYGSLFSKDKKHLFIRQQGLFDIFILTNNKFKLVCTYKQNVMSYLDDTLKDVNGDGYKDFLTHWYPPSGCCRRNVYEVFLYQPKSGGFTSEYEFMNPTFSPKDKVIRGVEYGYSAGLYKYKWDGLKVDTLEFVYRDTSSAEKFYITKKSDYHNPPLVKNRAVTKIPKEYETIEDIDWFWSN